jgi:sugar O-acyltransferase (sialic acid O-acetyltransferase NeuD family)
MNRLLIVGAGNFGREVMDWALAVPPEKRDWELEGFLDNRADVGESLDAPYPVLGDPDTFEFTERHRLICAVGESAARLEYGRRLRGRGARFITLIHPTATIGSNCSWGIGCIFCPGTVITNHVTLGDFVVLNCYATVGHDAVLGDGCTLSGHAVVTGWAVLGEGVFMGTHASVLPKAHVGDHALIGAGSVVIKKALPRTTVMGVPARKIL